MYNMDDIRERVILVGVDTEGGETAERSLDELAELAATAGAEVTGRLIQTRECVHPATYIGRGKLIELKELLWETEQYPAWQSGRRTGLQSTGQNASDPGYFCRKSCIGRGKDPGRTGSAQIPGIPSVGTGKITVKTGRRNRYKRSGRKKAGNGSPSYPGADQSSEKRTGRCGAAQRIAPQSAESVRNESGSTGRIYVSRKKQY